MHEWICKLCWLAVGGISQDEEPEVTFGQQCTKQRAFVDVTPKYRVHEIPGDEDAASVLSVCVACLVAPWRSICCLSRILLLEAIANSINAA